MFKKYMQIIINKNKNLLFFFSGVQVDVRISLKRAINRQWSEILIRRNIQTTTMLIPQNNFTSWASNWTTLHQTFCNDTLLGCAEECNINSGGFDHLCTTVEGGTLASSITLFCTPCDYASCNVNVSLILNSLENIEGIFLSRIPMRDCNVTFFEEEVSLLKIKKNF